MSHFETTTLQLKPVALAQPCRDLPRGEKRLQVPSAAAALTSWLRTDTLITPHGPSHGGSVGAAGKDQGRKDARPVPFPTPTSVAPLRLWARWGGLDAPLGASRGGWESCRGWATAGARLPPRSTLPRGMRKRRRRNISTCTHTQINRLFCIYKQSRTSQGPGVTRSCVPCPSSQPWLLRWPGTAPAASGPAAELQSWRFL